VRRRLLAVAHGTRDARGTETVDRLLRRVRSLRPELDVRLAYIELAEPLLDRVLGELTGPFVAVPLLLGAGYHTRVDIAGRVPPGTPVAPALGPHPLLAEALLDRARQAGWRQGEPIVLAGAGSSDPDSVAAAQATARLVATAADSPVRTAFVTSEPRLDDVLTDDATVVPYLLAPGRFNSLVAKLAAGTRVADPLGDHPALAALVLHRYDSAGR
jgi:sirohydrochlorin ferrochelatase